MEYKVLKQQLQTVIASDVYIEKDIGNEKPYWIYDFRNIVLTAKYSNLIADIFWETYKDKYPFQVGGLEVASIPIISAIVTKSLQHGKPTNGFFIRKSRKKHGLYKMIEGVVTDEPIILVDDLINSGKSFLRQLAVLDELDKKITDVFVLLQFRESGFYNFFPDKNIALTSVFTLPDLGKPFLETKDSAYINPYTVEWYFQSKNFSPEYVVNKSTPVVDDERVYFGSDSGFFWAINQSDGTIAWKKKVGWHPKGKSIFSTPIIHDGVVFFGAYDGNVYALDCVTGKKKWIYMEADWIGSSPAISEDLELVFIGLEFGLFKKQGGIAALDLHTGKKKWEYIMPEYTHCSPAYDQKTRTVAIGSNDNVAYLFNAKNGKLLWKYEVGGPIKGQPTFDRVRKRVIFASHDGGLYIFNIKTGKLIYTFQTEFAIYSNPEIHENRVYFSSCDKKVYCLDLDTFELHWSFQAVTRIFATPKIIGDHVYIGTNGARMYKLDIKTGKEIDFFQVTERVTNQIAYNEKTKRIFLPTYANEIYCLTEKLS